MKKYVVIHYPLKIVLKFYQFSVNHLTIFNLVNLTTLPNLSSQIKSINSTQISHLSTVKFNYLFTTSISNFSQRCVSFLFLFSNFLTMISVLKLSVLTTYFSFQSNVIGFTNSYYFYPCSLPHVYSSTLISIICIIIAINIFIII